MGNKVLKITVVLAFAFIFLSVGSKTVEANGVFSHERECKKWEYYSFGHCHRPKPPAPTLTLTAIPTTIIRGATSTLSWTSANAESCFASGVWKGWKKLDGEKTLSPRRTSTYKLTCFGKGGKVSEGVTIKVTKATTTPPVVDICPNIEGAQETLPNGYHLDSGNCITNIPEPTDVCPNIDGIQGTIPSGYHLDGENCVEDVIPPVDVCPNIEGVQETIPADYHLDGEDCVPDLPPPPALDHLVISEVYYDVDTAHGIENNSSTGNEWIELYNPTDSPIDIAGWILNDATATDTVPTTTPFIIPSHGFGVITPSASTTGFWSIPSRLPVLVINSAIGNGLANGGDTITIKNGTVVVDAMSYGSNASVLSLPVPVPSDGHAFRRTDPATDTDTASDWQDTASPAPGS